jgi:hypothetical protein
VIEDKFDIVVNFPENRDVSLAILNAFVQ